MTTTDQQADGARIPLLLGGDLHRCGRCKSTFTSQTWHVIENWTEREGRAWHTDVCRRCAYMDPALAEWQNYCDLADSIDQVMQGAKDQAARNLLKDLITSHTDHMSVWRWPEDQPPHVPADDEDRSMPDPGTYIKITSGAWEASGHQCGDLLVDGCDEVVPSRLVTVHTVSGTRAIGRELGDCPNHPTTPTGDG